MKMVQCELQQGSNHMVTWLLSDSRLKVSKLVSLDKEDGWWTILSISAPVESGDIKRGFKNSVTRDSNGVWQV